jgi:hypothetical protein
LRSNRRDSSGFGPDLTQTDMNSTVPERNSTP